MKKKSEQGVSLQWIFPDVFNSVAVALLTHYPSLREADMKLILHQRAINETVKFITKTAKDLPELIQKQKLELTDEYVDMVVSFAGQTSPFARLVRNESNDAFIDTTIAWEARKAQRTIHLPNRRQ